MNRPAKNFNIARWALQIIATAVMTVFAINSYAHQQREVYTTLNLNQQNGTMEVMHRVLLHDAEHIFPRLVDYKKMGLSLDLASDKRSQQVFANYIESSFSIAEEVEFDSDMGIAIEEVKPLSLTMVGFEVEGKYFWVYQESNSPANGVLLIKHSAMQEFWPDHINHINIEHEGQVQSIRLQKSDMNRWHSLKLLNTAGTLEN